MASPLKIPPFRCPQHVAWPLGGSAHSQHIVVDFGPHGAEVLHTGPGFQHPKGIYTHRGIAEAVAEALAVRAAAPSDHGSF